MRRVFSPAFFVLVLAVVFLPFVSVSCNVGPLQGALEEFYGPDEEPPPIPPDGEITVLEATGFEILTDDIQPSRDLEQLAEAGDEQLGDSQAHGRIWVLLAVVAAIVGIGVALAPGLLGPGLTVAAGVVGAALLGMFAVAYRSGIDRELAGDAPMPGVQATQFLDVSYQYGYWLALVFFLAAAAVGGWRLLTEREVAVAAPPGEPAAPPPGEPVAAPPPVSGAPPEEPMGPPPGEPAAPPPEPGAPPEEPMVRPDEPGGPPPPGEDEPPRP